MARSAELFESIGQKLNSTKPAIRLNLLRIMGSICDATDEGGLLLERFGLFDLIRELQVSDSAVLVRSMAQELVRTCEEVDNISIHSGSGGGDRGKRRLNGAGALRRTSASSTPPHLLERQLSMPIGASSPQLGRSERCSIGLFEASDGVGVGLPGRVLQTPRRQRNGIAYMNGSTAVRPASQDGGSCMGREGSPAVSLPVPALQRVSTTVGNVNSASVNGGSMNDIGVSKSRLPRGMAGGPHRMSGQSTAHVNGTRDTGGSKVYSAGKTSGVARPPRESFYGGRNGDSGVDITIASARRTTARRHPSRDGKWS